MLAPRSLASSPAASTTSGAPGSRSASRNATRPAPVPPAAQGLGHPGSAVVGRRPPDARDDRFRTVPPRRLEQLAESVGRRPAWVTPRRREQGQAAGGRELDDGLAARFDQTVLSRDGITERAFDLRRAVVAVVGRDQRLHGAIAAVGDRKLDYIGAWKNLAHAERDGRGGFGGGQRPLESVGSNNDPHAPRRLL